MNVHPEDSTVEKSVRLPAVSHQSTLSVEEALMRRRSIRDYQGRPISLQQAGQILWAAQGLTDKQRGRRTAASAGARYPLEIYLAAGAVSDLPAGIYRYDPAQHQLAVKVEGDFLGKAAYACRQDWIAAAAAAVAICAVYRRTTDRYGERGIRYVHMDVGIAAANVYLQAESLHLGTVFVGAFVDRELQSALRLPDDEKPLCILPIGWPLSG